MLPIGITHPTLAPEGRELGDLFKRVKSSQPDLQSTNAKHGVLQSKM